MSTGVRRGNRGKEQRKTDQPKCNSLQHKCENRGGKRGTRIRRKQATEKPALRREIPNGEEEGVI